ncbi:protein misato homolog 1 [Phtheirospermum japonicum]|uniref:Protein misato homolog 1 n=1 Tax=Phtheirospermum japonicum TaxID=374723 RepID=A0A830CPQ9_9LAMI|nr:protein misato homolog 1 [Phtheirospermum japonicum]
MKEIVTIQVGSYANFVGSHFWNFQDELLGLADSPDSDQIFTSNELNMDVLYRTGETQQGILTYTPRLVSVDFQGSLGSVSSHGTLYNDVPETSADTLTWAGPVTTQTSQPLKKNLFLQSLGCESGKSNSHSEYEDKDIVECLENDGVQYWTDFSKVHYHPQSLYELSGVWSNVKDFNNYGIGREAFSMGLHAEEINERLRFFVEECDLPQGFQFIIDDSGGFAGVASEFLENIADEYSNIPVLLYSVRGPELSTISGSRKQAISRKLHDAVSFSKLSAFCKLVVPLGLPSLNASRLTKYLHLEDGKPYHTSAVYASAIHSISLPFRMQPLGPTAQVSYTSGAVNIKELVQMLACQARQNMVTVLDVAMPAPAFTGTQAIQQTWLDNLQPLTPEIAEDVEDMHALEAMTIHGAFVSGSKRASISDIKDAVQAAYVKATEKPKFSHLSIAQCPLPIPLPFPSIFGKLVGRNGELLDTPNSDSDAASRGSLEVHSVPMAARLRSSIAVLPFLENRLENIRKFGIARGALGTELLGSWGLGKEDIEELGETLSNMVNTLNPASQISSDSD